MPAPEPTPDRRHPPGPSRLPAALLLILSVAASVQLEAAEDAGKARQALDAITSELNALDAWLSDAEKRQRNWQRELKRTDQNVAATAGRVRLVEQELATTRTELAELSAEQDRLQAQRREQARRIADHIAAAYRLNGDDFFKALLNQERPDQLARMLRYHQVLSEARTESLVSYEQTLAALTANVEATRAREATLAEQKRQLDERRAELAHGKSERAVLLARLDTEMRDREAQRAQLVENQERLEALLAELAQRAQRLDGASFAKNRGRLPWPLKGRVTQTFGSARAGGRLKWQGIFIAAPDGTEVRAIHPGRVAFADWLRGFGLLTIVDHGSGYMTLYAHADVLYKSLGDWVEGGEPIATAGTSGGHSDSGLYFEIRTDGQPRDPIGWLSRR